MTRNCSLSLSILSAAFFSTTLAQAATVQASDLSGAWRFSFRDASGQKQQYDLILSKSNLAALSSKGDGSTVPYYQVVADTLGKMKVVGLRVFHDEKSGKEFLGWMRFRGPNDPSVKGTELDGESNIVISQQGNTIVLGGDHAGDLKEEARMERLPFLASVP